MTSAPKLTQEDRAALREFLTARFEQRDRVHDLLREVISRRPNVEGVQRFVRLLNPPPTDDTQPQPTKIADVAPVETQTRRSRDVVALLGLAPWTNNFL